MVIKCWTDGAATMKKNEDGEYLRSSGGSSAIFVGEDNKEILTLQKGFEIATNNYCELYAISMAIGTFLCEFNDDDKLIICSDSAYCVNMLKAGGWVYGWKKNGWVRGKNKPIENLEIIKEIYCNLNDRISFEKVKGHTGKDDWNNKADILAVEAKRRAEKRL